MTKRNVRELNDVLNRLSYLGTTKFKYVILENIDILKPSFLILELLEKKANEIIADFDKDRKQLINEIGSVRRDNYIGINPNNEEELSKFKSALVPLMEKHKDSLDRYEEEMKNFNELLNEEIEEPLVFNQISIDQFPDKEISIEDLTLLKTHKIIKK